MQILCSIILNLSDDMMLLRRFVLGFIACVFVLSACDEDEYTYPSLITEFTDLYNDSTSGRTMIENDNGDAYVLSSTLSSLEQGAVYRVISGYELTGGYVGNYKVAVLYTLTAVDLLYETEDSTSICDPTGVTALWRGGNYINFHLNPKTQGGTHEWDYRRDSVVVAADSAYMTHYLSLYHIQGEDPTSYSTTVYAGIYLPSTAINEGDSIVFSVQTFEGVRTWHFMY